MMVVASSDGCFKCFCIIFALFRWVWITRTKVYKKKKWRVCEDIPLWGVGERAKCDQVDSVLNELEGKGEAQMGVFLRGSSDGCFVSDGYFLRWVFLAQRVTRRDASIPYRVGRRNVRFGKEYSCLV
jgi:hypothetical protein